MDRIQHVWVTQIRLIEKSVLSVDKVKQFSMSPPGFHSTIDMVVNYYMWLYIVIKYKTIDE